MIVDPSRILALARQGLEERPSLNQLLGTELLRRAEEPDGLLNPLVRGLCRRLSYADVWESLLTTLKRRAWTRRFEELPRSLDRSGTSFDDELQSLWAELQAVDTFLLEDLQGFAFIRPGRRRSADFRVRWHNHAAIVEVKRCHGWAPELQLAEDVIYACRFIDPDLENIGITIWASAEYHDLRLGRRGFRQRANKIENDLRSCLVHSEAARLLAALRRGRTVELSDGMIYAARNRRSASVLVRPFSPKLDAGILASLSSARAVSVITEKVSDTLVQLSNSGKAWRRPAVLVAYIYYDAWELLGVDLSMLADTLSEVLHWTPNVNVILQLPSSEREFYGRDADGRMRHFPAFRLWVDSLR